MDFTEPEYQKQYAKVIARAWSDPAFRMRLLKAPAEVLKEYGIEVPPGIALIMLEDTEHLRHLSIPSNEKVPAAEARP